MNGQEANRREWPRTGPIAAVVAVLGLLGAVLVSTVVFDRLPHVEDDVAFLFQANTIASGRLVADSPPHAHHFYIPFTVHREGMWFGKYPPGYPMVLALGVLAGGPWLVGPAFGALAVWLVYAVGKAQYGRGIGLVAAALLASSPFFLIQAGSFLSHAVCLFWAVLFTLLFGSAVAGRWVAGLLGGMALGMLFLSRPLTGVAIGLPFLVWALVDLARVPRRLFVYLPLAIGFAPFVGAWLAYNQLTTGHPLVTAYELYWPYDKVGFGSGIGHTGYHGADEALLNTRINLGSLAEMLFGWPGRLSLLPATLAALWATVVVAGRRFGQRVNAGGENPACLVDAASGPPPEAWDLLNLGVVVSLVVAYMAYWAYGDMYGPRYYFEAMGSLVLLSARGLGHLRAALSGVLAQSFLSARAAKLGATVVVLAVLMGLTGYGLGHYAPNEFAKYIGWYGIDGEGIRLVRQAGIDDAVVFVRTERWTDYAPFFSLNNPSLDSDVVYAIDHGPARNRELMRRYSGRSFYRFADGRLELLSSP